VNKTHLKHILYSVDIYFNQIEQNWNSSVNIEYLIPPSTKNSLIILAVEWGRSIPLNSLIFFTNNPFGELEDSILNNSMPLISNFTKRRFLLTLE
jgi:hypothetical protein